MDLSDGEKKTMVLRKSLNFPKSQIQDFRQVIYSYDELKLYNEIKGIVVRWLCQIVRITMSL